MKLLVVGFNARPIAKSALNAGYDLGVVDYFGDLDLIKLTKNCFSVLKQKSGETLHRVLNRKPAEYLYILSEIMVEEQGDFDGIILGSAFDRFPEIITQFKKLPAKLYANSPKKFRLTRDINKIQKIAKTAGFSIPETKKANDWQEILEIGKNMTFPIVTRSGGGGGGAGIRLWRNFEELKEEKEEIIDENESMKSYFVQEYIEGIDASASIIGSKKENKIVSINEQLIGDKNLNSPGRFSYCGNIVPLSNSYYNLSNKLIENLQVSIKKLFSQLSLLGTNGVDFVIKDGKTYFMEINPRFQGSIECIEYATGINIVKHHIKAFHENTIDLPEKPMYKNLAIKGILFSNSIKTFQVKKYPKVNWIVDRTHEGVLLEEKDPFCSIVIPTKDRIKGYKKVIGIANRILKANL